MNLFSDQRSLIFTGVFRLHYKLYQRVLLMRTAGKCDAKGRKAGVKRRKVVNIVVVSKEMRDVYAKALIKYG